MNINDWVMSGLGRCDQGILRRVAPLDDGCVAVAPLDDGCVAVAPLDDGCVAF